MGIEFGLLLKAAWVIPFAIFSYYKGWYDCVLPNKFKRMKNVDDAEKDSELRYYWRVKDIIESGEEGMWLLHEDDSPYTDEEAKAELDRANAFIGRYGSIWKGRPK